MQADRKLEQINPDKREWQEPVLVDLETIPDKTFAAVKSNSVVEGTGEVSTIYGSMS